MHRTLLLLGLVLGGTGLLAQTSDPGPLRTAGDRPVDIRHLRLDLEVDLPAQTVQGRATLTLRPFRPTTSLRLDAVEFEVHSAELVKEGKEDPVRFRHDGRNLFLLFDSALPADTEAVVRIDYQVRRPRAGLHFFGPTRAEPNVPLTVWSQGEAADNRYWFPCLDQPNQRQSTELVVTVPEGYEVLSNGALLGRKPMPEKKAVTFHWSQEKPHPSYLVTLVVGRFDIVREEWDGRPVLYYVPSGRKPDVARSFGRTREMLDYFTRRFGPYPWEKYAQVVAEQFTHGGMENTSATTLTDRVLHDERALLDHSPDVLIAHELAHQWWGDMVTCRDWAHLWLNEGFASYAEALWAEHRKGPDEYAYTLLVKSRLALAGGKERPIVDRRYPTPRSMFDARSYPKGAFVLHMLRCRLGDVAFWKGLQRYGVEHRFRSVETQDFRRTLERVTGRDLERFFHDWTERPGHPVLEVTSGYDAEHQRASVEVKQTQAGEPFHFPLAIRLGLSSGGSGMVVEEMITEKFQRLTIPLEAPPTRIEIDPNQGVLAEVKETKGNDLWRQQVAEGTTVVSRVRAAEALGASKLPADREMLIQALEKERFWGVQVEIAAALGTSGGETSRDALIAGLRHPHPRVRRACATQLGHFRGDERAVAALKELLARGDASYFVEAAALGAYARLRPAGASGILLPWLARGSYNEVLRTTALEGLGQVGDPSVLDVLVTWTQRGKPRACRVSAVQALARLVQTAQLGEEAQGRVLRALRACLEGEEWPLRRAVVQALRDLGRAAAPTRDTLESLVRHDPDERVREAARQALERVRTSTSAAGEMTRLREELERLRGEQQRLRERLERFERGEHKGS